MQDDFLSAGDEGEVICTFMNVGKCWVDEREESVILGRVGLDF
jgi:hypothetical protein